MKNEPNAPAMRTDLVALQVVADTLDHHELGNAALLVRHAAAALAAERARADRAEGELAELRRRYDTLNHVQVEDLPFLRQKAKADAWEEGYDAGLMPSMSGPNPYRLAPTTEQ